MELPGTLYFMKKIKKERSKRSKPWLPDSNLVKKMALLRSCRCQGEVGVTCAMVCCNCLLDGANNYQMSMRRDGNRTPFRFNLRSDDGFGSNSVY